MDMLPCGICSLAGVPEQIPRMQQYGAHRGKLLDGIKSVHTQTESSEAVSMLNIRIGQNSPRSKCLALEVSNNREIDEV